MRRLLKITGGILAIIFLLVCMASAWYLIKFYPRKATEFTTGAAHSKHRVLIATQGSDFKDAVVNRVVSMLKGPEIFISVVDVSRLPDIDPDKWVGIAVLNTSMADNPNEDVKRFLSRVGASGKILVVTTSGGGDYVIPNLKVDGITTASQPSKTESIAKTIYQKFHNSHS